jgi:hypothetical protein
VSTPADDPAPRAPFTIASLAESDGDSAAYAPPVLDRPSRWRADTDKLRLGDVLARTLRVAGAGFAPFLALAALAHLPLLIHAVLVVPGDSTSDSSTVWVTVQLFGAYLAYQIANAGIAGGTTAILRGEQTSFRACASLALQRLLPTILVSLLGLFVMGCGFSLLYIPGLLAAGWIFVAIPVSALERPGILASLNRSAALGKGNAIRVLGLATLLGVLYWLSRYMVRWLSDHVGVSLDPSISCRLWSSISLGVAALYCVFGSVLTTVTYHDLRRARQDGTEDLARVFD